MAFTLNPTWATEVYDANPGAGWVNLDLSAHVGAARRLVFLIVRQNKGSPGSTYFGVRPDGEALDYKMPFGASWGVAYGDTASDQQDQMYACVTNDSGVVEISDANIAIKIYLLGWCPWTWASSVVFASGVLPAAWTDLDLSAAIGGSGKKFALLRYETKDTDIANLVVRRKGDPAEYLPSFGYCTSAAALTAGNYANVAALIPVDTDDNVIMQQRQDGTANAEVVLMGSSPVWTPVEQAIFSGAFPIIGPWTTLDLSPFVGKRRVVVLLSAASDEGSPILQQHFFWPADITRNSIESGGGQTKACACAMTIGLDRAAKALIPTSADGVIDWYASNHSYSQVITLEGYLDLPEAAGGYRPSPMTRIAGAVLDLAQAAATYDAFEAVNGDVLIESASFYVATPGADFTSVAVATDQTNPVTLLTAAEGAVANIVAQKTLDFAYARFPFLLEQGQKIQYTLDGAGTAGAIALVVTYRPAILGESASLGAA
jgi:hypothetical protein